MPVSLLKPSRATAAVSSQQLTYETHEPLQLVDITDDVKGVVGESGVSDGIVSILSRHTTAAIRIQEGEPLLLRDLLHFLRRLAPSTDHYLHNDFEIRTHHMHPGESPNGHSHCLQFLLGSSETVPVKDGQLLLGQWQRIFLVELDGPRPQREVLIQTLGVWSSQY
jgi:secondary thiamine-phosphate synthase enzyme